MLMKTILPVTSQSARQIYSNSFFFCPKIRKFKVFFEKVLFDTFKQSFVICCECVELNN